VADAFLTTQRTWLGQKLALGEEAVSEVSRHVMEVYREPLRIYFRGMAGKGRDDADDVVQGFFSDRLSRPDFLPAWQKSGLPLRRWLMNAFCFYMQERRRQEKRDRRGLGEDGVPEIADPSPSADVAMDRAYAVSLVRLALETTRAECAAAGLGDHWRIFVRHHLEGRPYADLASALGVTPERASIMARTVRRRFARTLEAFFDREGLDPERAQREIRSLLEVIPW
jgi:DNA-directed RNA polymerase specialized sigma24 family protein